MSTSNLLPVEPWRLREPGLDLERIGLLGRVGPVNLTAALRRHARDPRRPLATLGIRLG